MPKKLFKIEDARNKVISEAEKVQHEVKKRLRQAEETALEETNKLRKATIAASWWIFATVTIPGLASILGGILAYTL